MASTKFYQCEEHGGDLEDCEDVHELRYQAEMADPIEIREAIGWIEDCFGRQHASEYSPKQPITVVRVINRMYIGGWDQFRKDAGPLTDANYLPKSEPRHRLRLV